MKKLIGIAAIISICVYAVKHLPKQVCRLANRY